MGTCKYEYVTNHERLGYIAERIERAGIVGIDCETTGLDPYTSKLRLFTCTVGASTWVIDTWRTGGLGNIPAALHKSISVGHNLRFDAAFLQQGGNGVLGGRIFDTHRASQLLDNGKGLSHDLYALYERYLGLPPGQELGASDWSAPVLADAQLEYAAGDTRHLGHLRKSLLNRAHESTERILRCEFDLPVCEAAIELAGFPVAKDPWLACTAVAGAAAHEMRHELGWYFPPDLNLDSPAQVKAALANLGIDVPNTNKTTLAPLAGKHPVVDLFMRYRKAAKQVQAFGEQYLDDYVHPVTGRIHPSYWPFTGCWRYSCSKPNLQQIPNGAYRKAFTPGPGRVFVIADYSQIELRIVAELSKDPVLLNVFRQGIDAHTQTASILTGKALGDVTHEDRRLAKPINFGLMYGMGAEKLVLYAMVNYGVALTLPMAASFRDKYFRAYANVRKWHREVVAQGRAVGYAQTIGGLRRYLGPDEWTTYINTPVQGTGANGLKRALRLVWERLLPYGNDAFLCHMVHDELVVECRDAPEIVQPVAKLLRESMVEAMQEYLKLVPVVVEVGIGPNWGAK